VSQPLSKEKIKIAENNANNANLSSSTHMALSDIKKV
jgi:hypothetical protein